MHPDYHALAEHESGFRRPMMKFLNTRWTWAFALVVLIQAVVVLALESYVFGRFQSDSNIKGAESPVRRSIPTYLSLLIFGLLYEILLSYDALRSKNTIQVIGLCAYNLGILIYTSIEKDQINEAVNSLKNAPAVNGKPDIKPGFWSVVKAPLIAIPIVVGVMTVVMSYIAWKLYEEFAWTIYKQISADLRMKRRYLVYQIYIALLKFDFFFFVGFTVQFLVIVSNTPNVEFGLTIAALPVTILILILAAWSVKRERLWSSICVILWYFAALAYFMFKLVRMYASNSERIEDYKPSRRPLTSFAVITILLMVVTITIACWCITNYGNGLEQYLNKKSRREENDESKYRMDIVQTAKSDGPASASMGPSRMVID